MTQSNRTYNALAESTNLQIINEDFTKTVGSGKDFETFQGALNWLATLTGGNGHSVHLLLDAGVHLIEYNPDLYQYYYDAWSLIVINGFKLYLEGNAVGDTTLGFKNDTVNIKDNGYSMFYISNGGMLDVRNLTIDTKIDGLDYFAWNMTDNSVISFYTSHTKACGWNMFTSSSFDTSGTTFETGYLNFGGNSIGMFDNSVSILNSDLSQGYLNALTVDNCAMITGVQNISFTGSDGFNNNVPLNEIQFDGSYISDESVGMLPKGAVGTTLQAWSTDLDNTSGTNTGDETDATLTTGGLLTDAMAVKVAKIEDVGTLTSGANVAVDMSNDSNFALIAGTSFTLDNPTGLIAGQRGFITIYQDATGSRLITLGANYKTAGGAGITLTTTANAIDLIRYEVISSTRVLVELIADIK